MSNYLLEIGLEEMPAHLVTPAIDQLAERLSDFLSENRVKFDKIEKFSTPRRLALLVEGIAAESESIDDEVKGPSAKIAKDAEGNWSKAIQGFSRGQGLTPDDLELRGDYYYAKKHIAGQKTTEILTKIGDEVISKMQFKTYMKWGNNSFLFVRPIQWIVSLFDAEVVKFDLLDVTSGRTSRGHRFLANHAIELVDARFYEKALQDSYVIVYAPARKLIIAQQIYKIADKNKWNVTLHDDLLEEVNNLIEWPTAFVGNFDAKYLAVPEEVLVTSMRDNQRYFEVYEQNGKLAPHFISVRNGNAENLDNVILGNEKVLVARLEDAEFFYQEDQKLAIADLVKKLEKVTFHAKIGSMTEHMNRSGKIAADLAVKFGLSDAVKSDVKRASEIYKFDLLTGMVGEFSELQGIMGEKYAALAGENPAVAQAVREHYLPISADGELPESETGALLAIADKLDSLISFFNAGLIPSGSNDPYALRRATQGLVRILEQFDWHFDLDEFLSNTDVKDKAAVLEFVKSRIQKLLLDEFDRHDLVNAAIDSSDFDIAKIMAVAKVLDTHKTHEPFKAAVENISRVMNLVKKEQNSSEIAPENFTEAAETRLYKAFDDVNSRWSNLTNDEKFKNLVKIVVPEISNFFENVMVMVDDEKVKNNRLALLTALSNLTKTFADFTQIITK